MTAFDKRKRQLQHILLDTWQPEPHPDKYGDNVMPETQGVVLRMIANRARWDDVCIDDQTTLASNAKITKKKWQRAIYVLTKQGIISTENKVPKGYQKPRNHHRVSWARLGSLCEDSLSDTDQSDVASYWTIEQCDATDRPKRRDRTSNVTPRIDQSDAGVASIFIQPIKTQSTTTPASEPLRGEWEELRVELYKGGQGLLKAETALKSARASGLSIAAVRGLWILARTPPKDASKAPGFGALCNWLTGIPPETLAEAEERYRNWQLERQRKADTIREKAEAEAKERGFGARQVTAGLIARRLKKDGLIDLASEDELTGEKHLDELDRKKHVSPRPDDRRVEQLATEATGHRAAASAGSPRATLKRPPGKPATEQRRAQLEREIMTAAGDDEL